VDLLLVGVAGSVDFLLMGDVDFLVSVDFLRVGVVGGASPVDFLRVGTSVDFLRVGVAGASVDFLLVGVAGAASRSFLLLRRAPPLESNERSRGVGDFFLVGTAGEMPFFPVPLGESNVDFFRKGGGGGSLVESNNSNVFTTPFFFAVVDFRFFFFCLRVEADASSLLASVALSSTLSNC